MVHSLALWNEIDFNHLKNLLIPRFVHNQENQFKPKHVRYDAKKTVCLPIGVNGWIAIAILGQMEFKVSL